MTFSSTGNPRNYNKNRSSNWKASASGAALIIGLMASPAYAQLATEDETVVTEIAAIQGQDFNGSAIGGGGFLPVVIGGEGDLLFLSRNFTNDALLSFDNSLRQIPNATPPGFLNLQSASYTIDSFGDQFAAIANGNVFFGDISDNMGSNLLVADGTFDGFNIVDSGNLTSGARPLILNGSTALLLSNVGIGPTTGGFPADEENFVLFSGLMADSLFLIPQLTDVSGASSFSPSSLSFGGDGRLISSTTPLLSAPNSAQTSNLFQFNVTGPLSDFPDAIGPAGSPQLNPAGGFLGGALNFAGFDFFDNTGGGFIGSGANFDAREFSANSEDVTFVLGNASIALGGGPGDDTPGELLVFNEMVIADTQSVATSIGNVDFLDFNDVLLADNGDIFFTSRQARVVGGNVIDNVGLWRVVNAGLPGQTIVPVLSVGDKLVVSDSGLSDLFPGGVPGGGTTATISGFVNPVGLFAQGQALSTDGRPRIISANAQGNIATLVEINGASGPTAALIAQDNDGAFHVVAFIGQQIDVDGMGDLRTITNFSAAFGSNDVDGAGDLFNIDEQLGFLVTLDTDATGVEEFDQAVLRVSLNGVVPPPPIVNFLFQGDCGDNFFGTLCDVDGDDGSNFVNADDIAQVSEIVPGTDGRPATVTINGTDVRVSGIDVTLVSINSNSALTIENGANFTITDGGSIGALTVDANSFTNGGSLSLDSLTTTDGAEFTNSGNVIIENIVEIAGDVLSNGALSADGVTINENSAEMVRFENSLNTNRLNIEEDVVFGQDVTVSGTLNATNVRIDGPGDIDILPAIGESRASVNFNFGNATGDRIILATDLNLSSGDLNFVNDTNATNFLTIEGDSVLKLTSESTTVLQDAIISGTGRLAIEEDSRLTSRQNVSIQSFLSFLNVDRSEMDTASALTIENGELIVNNVMFARDTGEFGEPVDQSTVTRINAAENSILRIREGGTLTTLGDFVRFEGGGTLEIDGRLLVASSSIFENHNTVSFQTDNAELNGSGLFRNRGTLSLSQNAVITTAFDNSEGGTIEFAGSALGNDVLQFQLSTFNAENSADNLLARGIELLTGNDVTPSGELPAVAALLQSNADHVTINNTYSFNGDAAAFLLGDFTLGDQGMFDIESDTILNARFSVADSFTVNRSGADNRTVHILDGDADDDLQFTGDGKVQFNNVDLFGFASADFVGGGTVVRDDDIVIGILSEIGRSAFGELRLGTTVGQDFDGLLQSLEIEDSESQFRATDVVAEDIRFRSRGISVFQNFSLRQSAGNEDRTSSLINDGLARLGGGFTAIGENTTVLNNEGARLDIDGGGEVSIFEVLENNGTLIVAEDPDGNFVNVADFTQRQAQANNEADSGLSDFGLFVQGGGNFTARKHDLITVLDAINDFQLGGNISTAGLVTLLDDFDATEIRAIAAGANISVSGQGMINNVTADGTDLERIDGKFSGTGRFTGENLIVGENFARASFDNGIESETLQVETNGTFLAGSSNNISATIILDELNVRGIVQQSGAAENMITNIMVSEGGEARFDGSVTTDIASINGVLFNGISNADAVNAPEKMFSARRLDIGSLGRVTTRDTEIATINIAQGGSLIAGELSFVNATIAGSLTADSLSELGNSPSLSILSGGRALLAGEISLGSLSMEQGSTLDVRDSFAVRSAGPTTVDGQFRAFSRGGSNVSFAGTLNIGRNGAVRAEIEGAVEAKEIFVEGTIVAPEIVVNDGSFEVSVLTRPQISVSILGPELQSTANVVTRRLVVAVGTGAIRNNGAITVGVLDNPALGQVLTGGEGPAGIGYAGTLGSFIQITGDARLSGDLILGREAFWIQRGNLMVDGFLREISANFMVDGSAIFRSPPQQMPAMPSSTGPALTGLESASSSTSFVQAVAFTDSTETEEISGGHIVSGSVGVTGDAEFGGMLWLRQEGMVQIGGNLIIGGQPFDDNANISPAVIATTQTSVPAILVSEDSQQPALMATAAQPAEITSQASITETVVTSSLIAENAPQSPLAGVMIVENAPQSALASVMIVENAPQSQPVMIVENEAQAEDKDGDQGRALVADNISGGPTEVSLPETTIVEQNPGARVEPIVTAVDDNVPVAALTMATVTAQMEEQITVQTTEGLTRIDGILSVGGNAGIGGMLEIGSEGVAQITGNANFNLATVDGTLMVGGDLIAEALTINGFTQFGNGTFGTLTIGAGATVLGSGFETAGDFTNLGTFQLGNPESGAGEFNAGGIFRQAGIFSGVGRINGSFVQEAVTGGPAAADILLNPGFSPGILNIMGDASFNDGVVLFEIGGLIPGVDHDQINVSGNLTIGSNAMIVVDLLELPDGSGIFLPKTGEEIVIFTASNISPDDVEQINFAVIDELPLGFTLVPDIMQNGDGEVFRVLRGFNGSTLSNVGGLDPAQLAVAGAIDFLSTAESGVPSPELFQLAVDLQFNEDMTAQLDSLTALGGTTISALQGSAFRAGIFGLNFAQNRLDIHAGGVQKTAPQKTALGAPVQLAALGGSTSGSSASSPLSHVALASVLTQRAEQVGGQAFDGSDGSTFRIIGSTSYHFGNSDFRLGAVGFDEDGWSANVGAEYETASGSLLLGATGTFGNIEVDLSGGVGTVETDSIAGTIYGQYRTDEVSVAVGYSFADLDIDSQRRVLGATSTGDTSGEVQHFFTRIGVDIINKKDWTFGPEISLTHSDLDIDGYIETGAGALSLNIPSLDEKSTRLKLAAKSNYQFDAGNWSGNLRLKAGYHFALSGDNFTTAPVAFTAAPGTIFANPLRPLQNNGVDLSAQLSLLNKSGMSLGIGYNGQFDENGQDFHDLSFNLSIAF